MSIDELRLQVIMTQLSQIVLLPIELQQLFKVFTLGHIGVLEKEHNHKVNEVFVCSTKINGHLELWGETVPLSLQMFIVWILFVEA